MSVAPWHITGEVEAPEDLAGLEVVAELGPLGELERSQVAAARSAAAILLAGAGGDGPWQVDASGLSRGRVVVAVVSKPFERSPED